MSTDDQGAADLDHQVAVLMNGCEFGDLELEQAMRDRLQARLAEALMAGRPLRVYAGYDPSAPDLHLGHSITLRKLRQFQELGHEVTVVIGTVTAMVGDTSDRLTGRPRKSATEVEEAARTYAEQVLTILDRTRTAVVMNGDWLAPMRLPEVLDLASKFTVQQFLARDNYRRRLDRGEPVGLQRAAFIMAALDAGVPLRGVQTPPGTPIPRRSTTGAARTSTATPPTSWWLRRRRLNRSPRRIMASVSDAVRPSGEAPHGTSLLPADLTDDQLDAAPVLNSIDSLLIEELSEDEDDAFAAALES